MDVDSYLGVLGIILIPILTACIGILIIYIIGLVKIFHKAGKSGWEAIVPFYNNWVLVEIAGLTWWWFLLLIAPAIVGLVSDKLTSLASLATLFGNFCCYYNIAKKFHKDPVSTAILSTIFPVVMIPIMGLSKDYQFDNSVPVSENGPFQSNSTTTQSTEEKTEPPKTNDKKRFCSNCGKEIENGTKFCANCGQKQD